MTGPLLHTFDDEAVEYVVGRWESPQVEAVITRAEARVLDGLLAGLPNEGIAASTFIALDTVKTHLRAIFAALGATNRGHAIALVYSGYVRVVVSLVPRVRYPLAVGVSDDTPSEGLTP